ncbi:prolipoprotein diacylglyceryl transferase [Kibdelosporangium persicum]|uniref:Phosphatidylglycerol--prolipoprotein diacylglyceryl transferase n=1 Tax=Kibdelosporangium persicum TaxID=2698649 RepID=A0ABX2FDT1_9PSEU|nr:prolipoprotein diacylglyceryl transferase family protein [Kibdelosporangium persicum]NRN69521.1 Phosphatidylglycerol--prolipoprotein diacylglyceryl transferase [Kibdelosporangium persicum]
MRVVSTWPGTPGPLGMVNPGLDRLARTRVRLFARDVPAFRLCGTAGLMVAVAVSQFVAACRGLSPGVVVLLAVVGVMTFLALALVTSVLVGRETLVYLHHEIALLAASGGVLWALGLPVLAYLDAVALGIGGFLVCGRTGCLLVGCCHGRPAQWGVRYGPSHVKDGFFAPYSGVRLLPVQLFEALWVLLVVIVGLGIVTAGYPPGVAFAWYVSVYGVGRFVLEYLRGDLHRPYFRGLSHNQWLTLVLAFLIALAGLLGALPAGPGFTGLPLAVLVVFALPGVARRTGFTHPCHVAEMAALLHENPVRTGEVRVAGTTSLGVRISVGTIHDDTGHHVHYGLSGASTVDLTGVASAILRVRHPEARDGALSPGRHGVVHLIVPAPGEAPLPGP